MTRQLRELIQLRRDAWRDVQCVEALMLCGFESADDMRDLEQALHRYEVIANAVEDARCEGV